MDKFSAMRVFVRVAELQSFTKAAESLNLPKATVSTSIQDLEAMLGAKLLHRTTRQVHLSSEGVSFLERCKDLLTELDETESMFKSASAQITGKIRVDMTIPMARDIFIPALPKFLAQHPRIEIELSSTDRRVDIIREGIDCVIRTSNYSEAGLAERELGFMTVVNVASPAYIKNFGRPKSLDDLRNHKLINFMPVLGGKPDGFEYFDGERYRETKMGGLITVNNIDSYKAACISGLGICQNPLVGVRKDLAAGTLVEILPKLKAEPMKVKIVYQERRMLSKRVRVFIDWLEPIIKQSLQ